MQLIEEVCRSGLLDETDATRFCRRGHFVYESGDHGDTALALDLLFADPRRLQAAAARLAKQLVPHAPDLVCGPLVGGALVGQWVAYELSVPFVYAERQASITTVGGRYVVPDELGVMLGGKRVVIVDDVINAGAATLACGREVGVWGGSVAAVASLLVRTPGGVDMWAKLHLAIEYLVGVEWNTWSVDACPLCQADAPIEDLP